MWEKCECPRFYARQKVDPCSQHDPERSCGSRVRTHRL
jgi:hypothetical protein